ncbi:MAG: GGDEF domain-containing protein [Oceanospirillaceae bacterium]|nr:GGDEF domain-containing protein [Oceanospirillaceae bacterium]
MRNLFYSLAAYHIAISISMGCVYLDIIDYSYSPFLYLLLLIYVTCSMFTYVYLKPAKLTLPHAQKIFIFQVVNWLLIFAIWSFFMADMRVVTLICSMMVLTFLFSYASFNFSLVINACVVIIYLVVGYVGAEYSNHAWHFYTELIHSMALFFSAFFMGIMVHRRTVLLKRQAHYDYLTRLLNRRAMTVQVDREFQRCERLLINTSIAMIDLDNFKMINDKYGHSCGDAVLKHVAAHFQESLRGTDLIARWGGEEFLALLVGISPDHAKTVLDRALSSLADKPMIFEGKEVHISFSAGISSLNNHSSAELAIQEADTLLYSAKDQGKQCVRCTQKPNMNHPLFIAT